MNKKNFVLFLLFSSFSSDGPYCHFPKSVTLCNLPGQLLVVKLICWPQRFYMRELTVEKSSEPNSLVFKALSVLCFIMLLRHSHGTNVEWDLKYCWPWAVAWPELPSRVYSFSFCSYMRFTASVRLHAVLMRQRSWAELWEISIPAVTFEHYRLSEAI